jgi:serine/threonine protein kinase
MNANLAAGPYEPRRVLVIDSTGEARDFLRYATRSWSRLTMVLHDLSYGWPSAEFDWSGYDFVVLTLRRSARPDQGLDWLREVHTRSRTVPPIVVLAEAPTAALQKLVVAAGAAAFFDKDDVSARAFGSAVSRMLESSRLARPSPAERTPPTTAKQQALHVVHPASATEVRIPGYRIHEIVARSTTTAVYGASRASDAQPIALKVLSLADPSGEARLQRFMQEYKVLSLIEHRNVVRVYERGLGPDYAFVAMEYCAGGDLKARIRAGITVLAALECLREIIRGLAAVHASGILHRDLKPASVLLRADGTVAISDFAIARELASGQRITQTQSILGSLYYVSPDMIQHRGEPDERADLYSAGAILHEMLTGVTPYSTNSVARLLDAHCFAPVPQLPPDLAFLQSLLDGLLAKDPEERFQSAGDVLEALELIERDTSAGPDGLTA